LRLTSEEFNILYISHQLHIPLRDVLEFTVEEYQIWCAYFNRLNNPDFVEELTDEEVARKNAKKFHGSNLYSMIFKDEEGDE
jgi:hypothetical protein